MSQYEFIRKVNKLEERIAELERRVADPAEDRAELARKYQEKFGKRPHHFLSAQRIREALSGG